MTRTPADQMSGSTLTFFSRKEVQRETHKHKTAEETLLCTAGSAAGAADRIANRTHPDIKLAREAEKLEKTRAYYAEKVAIATNP